MALKIEAKLHKELICCFKNDKNVVNFNLSTRNVYIDWLLLCKVFNV